MITVNDFTITVATANGSGSQSANQILVRTLFRMGLTVGGKNLFPSNIQGLPTWFTIRVNDRGFTARKQFCDVVVAINPATAAADLRLVRTGGLVIWDDNIKYAPEAIRPDIQVVRIPFKTIVDGLTESGKLKKLLVNVAYVGVLAEWLGLPNETLNDLIAHQFEGKPGAIELNTRAAAAGRDYVRNHFAAFDFPYRAEAQPSANDGKLLIDGNTAAGMGLMFGGCTLVAWYPITPSSSVIESFIEFAATHRIEADGKPNYAVVQAEDELASIAMVLGAGWAGARAMTATSGPGLSLMAEAAGLSYYAEIPAVIWNVQRVGPSTGLPTRTMQGDFLSSYYLSHGGCKHVVLLPGTPTECFEMAQTAFDLAESLQTLVIVLSDLDLGMNVHVCQRFEYPTGNFERGKVLSARDLDKLEKFNRYEDTDGDGIPYRTLTGTVHPKAAYFTRGTGHDESGLYSEDPAVYRAGVDRLARKFQSAALLVPKPLKETQPGAEIALVFYGSTQEASDEARFRLQELGIYTNAMRLRALPFCIEFEEFLNAHERVYVVEQNRDAQCLTLIRAELPQYSRRCQPVLHYDGLPIDAESIVSQILGYEGVTT